MSPTTATSARPASARSAAPRGTARVPRPAAAAPAPADAVEVSTLAESPELEATRDLDEVAPTADLVRVYLTEVGRTPLLTAEQEVDLSERIEAGLYADHLLREAEEQGVELDPLRLRDLRALAHDGRDAKLHMVRANLRLVVSVAKKYSHRGVPFLDVVQEGNLGLIRAVEKFDYRKGYKFSTYAMWWVRQAIGRGLAEQARTIRLPVHVQEELSKVNRVRRDLSQELGRPATDEEVAEQTGHAPERVAELLRVSRDPISLDSPVGDEGDTSFGDLVVDDGGVSALDTVEHQAMIGELGKIIDQLPAREALIVRMRYGLADGRPRTLDEIGAQLGLTRERIRQLEKLALAKLRHPSATRQLLDWAS
nr:sigma-70 family RNA polymerase sigma factor [Vallicoccus soli]